VHFYSSFWRFLCLNSGTVNCFRAGDAAPRRPYLGVRARRRLFPRWAAPSPGAARAEALGIRSPLRGASGVVDSRALPLPTGPSAAPPRSRAPVAVWGDTPASTSASTQLEAAAPIYRAGFSPEAEQTAPSAPPVQRRRASPEPAST
jgi:hypothetical protein